MNTFSIRAALKRGWRIFTGNKKLLILVTLIMGILSALEGGGGTHSIRGGETNLYFMTFGVGVGVFILSTVVQIGAYKIMLKLEDGQKASVYELLSHDELFFKYVLTQTILSMMVVVGLVLLVVPGLYIMMRYGFAPIIAVDSGESVGRAFKKSADITDGSKWKLFWLLVATLLVNLLGLLVLGVGILVSLPVTFLAWTHVYRKLLDGTGARQKEAVVEPVPGA